MKPFTPFTRPLRRRLVLIGSVSAMIVAVAIRLQPIHSKFFTLAKEGCFVVALAGSVYLSTKRKTWILALLGGATLIAVLLLMPGRAIHGFELQFTYLRNLADFEGTPYVWGGENARGIDCSRLPRRAVRDALLTYGIRHLNGPALRGYAEQVWF